MNKGFTLAEVLITLAIIGVVSAMIIPTLIQGQQEKATVTALKKTFSTLSSAYTQAEQENGKPDTWGMATGNSPTGDAPMLDKLKPYLKVDKDCTDGSSGCFQPSVMYKHLASVNGGWNIADNMQVPKLRLADGTLILAILDNANCGRHPGNSVALQDECGWYVVDVNGYKKPNQLGKDVFMLYLTRFGIVPWGTALDTTAYNFTSDCKNKDTAFGYGCAAWVIYNENLDYLHCSGLDWNGPTKCP